MQIEAKVVAVTQPVIGVPCATPEEFVAYCARVSNPDNQNNPTTAPKLLDYCIRNKHWSVFEMANAVVEVKAPRDITRQLLRHRSFSFQEFSQRYSDKVSFIERDFRRQDTKNRQNSVDDLSEDLVSSCKEASNSVLENAKAAYEIMLKMGVAKECARVVLPEGLTMSTLYVNGTLRSWLHYLDIRDDEGVTQWEHVVLAREIKKALSPVFPVVLGA